MASAVDSTFGPSVPGVFDFTVLFEQGILSILPSAVFALASAARIASLWSCRHISQSFVVLQTKLILAVLYTAMQAAELGVWSQFLHRLPLDAPATVADTTINLISAMAVTALIYFEHTRSHKPSILLNCYLLISALLDAAQLRTAWLRLDSISGLAAIRTASLALKVSIFILEELPKKPVLRSEKIAPEITAGFISRSVFAWLNSFFAKGYSASLGLHSIGDINDKFDSQLLLEKLERRWEKADKTGSWSLINATFSVFRLQFVAAVIPRLIYTCLMFSQPFLINTVIEYVNIPADERDSEVSSGLLGATAMVYVGMAVTRGWHMHMTYQLVTMYRGALVSIVYKNTLRLSPASIQDAAPITLISTDVESIASIGSSIHDMWIAFIEIPAALFLLYRNVGVPSLFILVPAALTTLAGALMSSKVGPARIIWSQATQQRVGETSSMLSQIKAIKFMGLTDLYHRRVQALRVSELQLSTKFRWFIVWTSALASISSVLTPMIVILAAIFWTKSGQGLSVANAFGSLAIISIAADPIIRVMASSMHLLGVIGCFTRIQTFLNMDTRIDPREILGNSAASSDQESADGVELMSVLAESKASLMKSPAAVCASVRLNNATFAIQDGEVLKILLHEIFLEIYPGSISMVTGRVGCGKTSLLKAILGELPLISGRIETTYTLAAYCDQQPWLINGTIEQNIVAKSRYDAGRLSIVLTDCCLLEDIAQLASGVKTIVGSGGISLSGGQKQRVALARAVYSDEEFLVLDDIFSGLDYKITQRIFINLFGSNGLFRRTNRAVILVTHNTKFLTLADRVIEMDAGKIVSNVSSQSIHSVASEQESDAEAETTDNTNIQDHKSEPAASANDNANKGEIDTKYKTGDLECYKIYLQSLGALTICVTSLLVVIDVTAERLPTIWIRLWTEKGTSSAGLGYMGGYVAFGVLAMLSGAAGLAYFMVIGIPKSANNLHNKLLSTVVRAPLHFFSSTDNGTTLNRFSQDIRFIDQALPMAFFVTAVLVLRTIVETALIASGASLVAVVIPACFLVIYFIQKIYLRTSRQVRILDLEAKSPLYTHFSETLAGLITIRAFGWDAAVLAENTERLDNSQKPYYMMFCIQRWLQVVLDLVAAGMAIILVAFAVKMPWSTSSGAIGLAMVNVVSFNVTLAEVVDQWTALETSLGAIARLKEFMKSTPNEEQQGEEVTVSSNWPERGQIIIRDLSASYSLEKEPVLRSISLTIKSGQRVGICGRSGSGKSSLVAAIARLLEIRPGGSITVDDVDLSTVKRQTFRSRIIALPQDALQIKGTVRENLDPWGTCADDATMMSALDKACLSDYVTSNGGLDATLSDLGLSVGQMQLMAISRVFLRNETVAADSSDCQNKGGIVLLDEATSNIDEGTEAAVRAKMEVELRGKTIIEVAHHLEVVRNYDVVIVMGNGQITEMGAPDELLQRDGSEFKALWESRGI